MDRVFAAIGRFCVRFRWPVLAIWIIGAVAAGAFLPGLSSVSQSDNSDFLPATAPSQQAAQLASPLQPAGERSVTIVAARAGGQLSRADQAALAQLGQALRGVPGVRSVRVVSRSPDGQAAQIQVLAGAGGTGAQAQKNLVTSLRSAIAATPVPSGLQVHTAGQLATAVDNNATAKGTMGRMTMLSLVFVIVLLLLVFRSLLAPLVTVVPAFLVVQIAGGLIAEAAQHGLQVSQIAQFLLIILVIGAGTDYGLFLVFRVREEIRRGVAPRDAVVNGVTRVGETITFSAGTVIAAMLSLLAATFSFYSNLGVPLAIGIGLMLVAGLTLLPALLAIVGTAVFWPARIRAGDEASGVWGRTAARIVRRPVVTLVAGVVVLGGLAAAVAGFKPSSILGGAVTAPAGSDSAAGNALLAGHFPQSAANPTNVVFRLARPAWNDPQPLVTLQRRLSSDPRFTSVSGPLDPNGRQLTAAQLTSLHAELGPARSLPLAPPPGSRAASGSPSGIYQAYRATGQYLSPDGRTVQYKTALAAGDPSGTAASQAVPAIRADAASAARAVGATGYGVAGEAPASYDVSSMANNDLRTVVPIAITVIAVLLALVLRSLVAPLYLIASVALSYLAALGLAVVLFMKLGGQQGMTFFLPFLMFIFLLALGEDYNILVMTRIREEAGAFPLRAAVTRAIGVTGTTVTSAGLILAGTFAVLAMEGGRSMGTVAEDVGVGLAVGVLMDTFLVRSLLVPSVAVLLGRRNWWPSRLGRRPQEPEDASPLHRQLSGAERETPSA